LTYPLLEIYPATDIPFCQQFSISLSSVLILEKVDTYFSKDGRGKKRRKEDQKAYERIKEGLAETEEDHLDLDLRSAENNLNMCFI